MTKSKMSVQNRLRRKSKTMSDLYVSTRFASVYARKKMAQMCRAKSIEEATKGQWVYGYYFRLNRAPSVILDNKKITADFFDVETGIDAATHFIITSGFSDWNMVPPMKIVKIDYETLCHCTGIPESIISNTMDGTDYIYALKKTNWIYENDVVDILSESGSTTEVFVEPGGARNNMLGGSGAVRRTIIGNIIDNIELISQSSEINEYRSRLKSRLN